MGASRTWAGHRGSTAVVACAGAVLVLAGCGGGAEPPPGGSASPTATTSGAPSGDAPTPPAQPPTAFDTAAATAFPEVGVRDVAVTDDLVLVMTSDTLIARTLPQLRTAFEVPAEAGALSDVRVDETGRRAMLVEVGTLPGEGTAVGTDRVTVTPLDLADGTAGEPASVDLPQTGRAGSAARQARVVGVTDEGVALIDTWTADADDVFSVAAADHRTVALDPATGRAAWQVAGGTPLHVADDTVLVASGATDRAGAVQARRGDDGRVRWSALAGTGPARVVGATGDTVSVTSSPPEAEAATLSVLGLDDGAVRRTVPTPSWNWQCPGQDGNPGGSDDARTVVCDVGGQQTLVGWSLARQREVWRLPTGRRFAPGLTAVHDGLAYGVLPSGTAVVIDVATGRDVASEAGIAPTAVGRWGGVGVLQGQASFFPAAD